MEFARPAGYQPGAHIFLDLEGITGSGPHEALRRGLGHVIVDGGYLAGSYVGYAVPWNAEELFRETAVARRPQSSLPRRRRLRNQAA